MMRSYLVTVVLLSASGLDLVSASDALHVISDLGSGRATAYRTGNRIVTSGDHIHVVWQDAVDDTFYARVRTYNRVTREWSPATTIGLGEDNHGGPVIAADSQGYLHTVFYPHNGTFHYRRSTSSNDSSQWGQEQTFAGRNTYPSLLVELDDSLILASRSYRDLAPTDPRQTGIIELHLKDPSHDWSAPKTIFHGNQIDPPSEYVLYQPSLAFSPDRQAIHMAFGVREGDLDPFNTNRDYALGYMRSGDGGNTWERADGTSIDLIANPQTMDLVNGERFPTTPQAFATGNIAVSPDGTPWTIHNRRDTVGGETVLSRPDTDGQWHSIPLNSYVQKRWPDRVAGEGTISFGADGRLYVATTTVLPETPSTWGSPVSDIALLVSDDNAQSFDVFEVSARDPTTLNFLPSIERNTNGTFPEVPSLVFTHGGKGASNSATNLQNEVVWVDVDALVAMPSTRGVTLTTNDRGDGLPGLGADAFVAEHSVGDAFGDSALQVGQYAAAGVNHNDLSYIRFDKSRVFGELTDAVLRLYYAGDAMEGQIHVYGLKDQLSGIDHDGNGIVGDYPDLHDEFWPENLLDYESAPGLIADGNPLTSDLDPNQTILLGSLTLETDLIEKNVRTIELKNPDLTSFIQQDTNDVITLILRSENVNEPLLFTSRETATFGNDHVAYLQLNGVSIVPEPATGPLMFLGFVIFGLLRTLRTAHLSDQNLE